ncbi:MAG TPA: DUF1259 domain-containing protein [Chthoniobacteraceae bacterium]|nr:DUF1259 domain-containing protein [Chthoniobacteraceae bacterium]
MKNRSILSVLVLFPAIAFAAVDSAKIESLTGLKGKLNEAGDVFKVSAPRNDVKASVDGWPMPPFMGLTSWAAFTAGKGAEAMVMGDLVLFQDEVNPVMSAALDAGLSVTALHNHFFFDEPKVFFMHIGGEGTTEKLAAAVKAALDKAKEIRGANAEIAKTFGKPLAAKQSAISGEKFDAVFGAKGEAKDGMFKVTIGRKAKMPCGCEVGKDMGVNTWAAFAGSDNDAIVDGDFVVLGDELQAVLTSLRKDGINIVAIHQHMTGEEPRYIFLHYWGRGAAADLAKAVKNALGKTVK